MAPANDFFLVAQTLAEEVGTLRARVAELEAALRDIADNLEPMSAAIAHAALGAGKETP